MELAIRKLSVTPESLLVDGNYFIGSNNFGRYDNMLENYPLLDTTEISYETVVSGDATYASIAAASVLAKEHHDDYIKQLVLDNPSLHENYDLGNNMGYGTAKHIAGLKKFGTCDLHRKTFLGKILSIPKKNLFDETDD